ncbi:amino acid ABC transporter substrate-binding protein [Rhodoblastus acidophilus]|uniref:Amino acid ABC transporter substrate-binding protein n=1 Tax=Candidatus Rhodoblastus alkanivorans TaxID=2954117 RepID=A0ABS9Z594_9HYPH|nr:amino acid ABC transporter substrate-binding protein [Candidatus Rhodoblastus alkanivorans]MCI4680545.1 amino acid ABC transporter substrate-binding protein [Candidatus Rhodoblastus alkanivorans]MCI4682804.1 amino acid ABC transporter substrate-binding protein [Candidatus Rhodoblastus alkanivorans]MDI4640113.1 amino acid ABC transporter substrate-binding protein [Rhodoblastus acidophilus]
MRKSVKPKLNFAAIGFAFFFLAFFAARAVRADTLDETRRRGFVVCGVNIGLAGFGLPDDRGAWRGFDIDYCRAVAAAIFDDPAKVTFIPLSAKDRFTALQSGEVDILSRNTTWTESREVGQGLLFTGINYFDGQGFMVRKSLGITSALRLNGASICAQQGTTTELNLADFFRSHGMKAESVVFASADEAIKAYDSGRCDAFTTDGSALYAQRLKLTHPEDHVVLKETISKEPFSPAVRQGDDRWFNLVKWTEFALLDAEELGVTSKSVEEMKTSSNPAIRRLLGVEGDFGAGLGLTPDWAARIVKAVGNYGEIFDRNLGKDSALKIPRGLNALWRDGGLHYAPPVR